MSDNTNDTTCFCQGCLVRQRRIEKLEEDVRDNDHAFELRQKADWRAIDRWQKATGKTMQLPDHADLCVWLMERLEEAEAALAEANKKVEHDREQINGLVRVCTGNGLAIHQLEQALQNLYDEQNGPPRFTRETEWNGAMMAAQLLLDPTAPVWDHLKKCFVGDGEAAES